MPTGLFHRVNAVKRLETIGGLRCLLEDPTTNLTSYSVRAPKNWRSENVFDVPPSGKVVSLVLAEFTRRCFVDLDTPNDLKLAIRGGTALLMISCLIGFLILFYGNSQAAIGADPSKVGQAGVAKFPHGVAIHAIQLFPLLCWLKSKLEVSLEQRFWMTNFCIASTGTFLVFSIFQTLSGKSRFDLNLVGGILFLGAALLFSPVAVAILYKSIRKLISPIQGT